MRHVSGEKRCSVDIDRMIAGSWVCSVFLSGIVVHAMHISSNSCIHKVIHKEMNVTKPIPPLHSRNTRDTTCSKWCALEWLVSRNKVSIPVNEIQNTNDVIMSNPYIAITFLTM